MHWPAGHVIMGAMSYTITVQVRGRRVESFTGGDVPDGDYEIAGHVSDQDETISCRRRSVDGSIEATATNVPVQEM